VGKIVNDYLPVKQKEDDAKKDYCTIMKNTGNQRERFLRK
jgi:hypothetical protein